MRCEKSTMYKTNDCSPVFQISKKKMQTSVEKMITLEMQIKIIMLSIACQRSINNSSWYHMEGG